MPKTYKFTSPEGITLNVNSPDGSMPTEQELDQMFATAGKQETSKPEIAKPVTPVNRIADLLSKGVNKAADFTFPIQPMSKIKGEGLPNLPTANPILKSLALENKSQELLKAQPNRPYAMNVATEALRGSQLLKPSTYLTGELAGYGASKALFPIASRIATTPIGRNIIQKQLPAMAKGLLEKTAKFKVTPLKTPATFIKNIANRSKASYLIDDVAPKASSVFNTNIQKFTPEVENYARENLKIPEGTIQSIKTKGYQNIISKSNELGNSTDPIYQKIEQGFINKRNIADKVYGTAIDSAPEGKQINIRPAIEQAGQRLKRLGLITDKGNLTELGQSEIVRDNVYGKLLDFYQSSKSISGVGKLQGIPLTGKQMATAMSAEKQTLVNKYQYTFLRDKLNALYKNKPSDIDVNRVVNQFYKDGEKSGIIGLQKARTLQREAFQAEENLYSSSLIKEKKLDAFQKMSEAEKRKLQQIEYYTGERFIDDLDTITASKYLDKFKQIDEKHFGDLLIKASDRRYTNQVHKELKSLVGEKDAKKIIDEVIAHRRAINTKKAIGLGVGGYTTYKIGEGIVKKISRP